MKQIKAVLINKGRHQEPAYVAPPITTPFIKHK